MDFAIYDVFKGVTALWSETLTVMVIYSIYKVQIGVTTETNSFPDNLYSGNRFLGITIEPDINEIRHRQLITCAPNAMRAEKVLVQFFLLQIWFS
jgi:hypothetical protein